jgi:hypothetical protein
MPLERRYLGIEQLAAAPEGHVEPSEFIPRLAEGTVK